ncbi:potassium-transporting ATPase subunit KdpC [Paenibacillus sp. GSMTC-2017]|uniref:potassium-transporting ATPase subunit KdpC n=1 Tax=Paenibacillus sp. GSMTC-2017 TaxID=2794350 RepID=UPI0018D9BDF9|nr:potassium-transporting ATPase subunit KdpC [Paenibacillus sp. GSMTC-2017]MBH5320448.1 potassium-transporting ATPase subunit KdpC [Paenibacillus sp. GSMTC-2017]
MNKAGNHTISIIIRTSFVLMLLCGVLYNLAVTGIAQVIMPNKADGSLVYNEDGGVIGSKLIGQSFADPKLFHGRVSSIDYDADGSGTPNYAPSNPDLLTRTQESIEAWKTNNPKVPVDQLPIDLITNSGSGLDPHISVKAALAQVPRISELSGMSEEELETLVEEHTEGRLLGLFGEPTVNVLLLNKDLKDIAS